MPFRSLFDLYFAPFRFELWRCGRIYELLGIRLYKRYLPSSGDLVSRWQGVRRISASGSLRLESLLRHKRFTKEYEVRHLVGGVIMLAISLVSVSIWKKGDMGTLLLANLLINGYPIMLQRYNRVRILSVLARLDDRQHKGSKTIPCT